MKVKSRKPSGRRTLTRKRHLNAPTPGRKHGGGRPSSFCEEFIKQGYKLALLGLTLEQMADVFDVHVDTVKHWKSTIPEFSAAIKKGGTMADAEVAAAVRSNARGFTHKAEKIFCTKNGRVIRVPIMQRYRADPIAGIFWLKNRQPELWRDRQILDHTNSDGSFTKSYADSLMRTLGMTGGQGSEKTTTH